jgi:hypothetical protein
MLLRYHWHWAKASANPIPRHVRLLRLREVDEELAAASFLTVKARVARALLELAEHLRRETDPGRITTFHKMIGHSSS